MLGYLFLLICSLATLAVAVFTVVRVFLVSPSESTRDVQAELAALNIPEGGAAVRAALAEDKNGVFFEKLKKASKLRADFGRGSPLEEFLRSAAFWNAPERERFGILSIVALFLAFSLGGVLGGVLFGVSSGLPYGFIIGTLIGSGGIVFYLTERIQALRASTNREFPHVVELFLSALSSMPDVPTAMERVVNQLAIENEHHPLVLIYAETRDLEKTGIPFEEAFRRSSGRSGQRFYRALAAILVLSEGYGSERSSQLRELSMEARTRAGQGHKSKLPMLPTDFFGFYDPPDVQAEIESSNTDYSELLLFLRRVREEIQSGDDLSGALLTARNSFTKDEYLASEIDEVLARMADGESVRRSLAPFARDSSDEVLQKVRRVLLSSIDAPSEFEAALLKLIQSF